MTDLLGGSEVVGIKLTIVFFFCATFFVKENQNAVIRRLQYVIGFGFLIAGQTSKMQVNWELTIP